MVSCGNSAAIVRIDAQPSAAGEGRLPAVQRRTVANANIDRAVRLTHHEVEYANGVEENGEHVDQPMMSW